MVGWEAARHFFQLIAVFEDKAISADNGLMEGVAVDGDFFADAFQNFRVRAIETGVELVSVEEAVAFGFYVEVIAGEGRFLAVRRDVGTHVRLVRQLVGRKTRVAVETVGTILEGQVLYRRIKRSNARNQLFQQTD